MASNCGFIRFPFSIFNFQLFQSLRDGCLGELVLVVLGRFGILEMRIGKGVVLPDFRRGTVVQDHVHLRQGGGGVVHFLPVNRQVVAGGALGFVVGLEQQRAGPARGIVNGLAGAGGAADADDLGHDARNFRRGVELALALAGLGGEVAHQVFVGVAQQIVALGPVGSKIQILENGDEIGEAVHHFLALAQLVGVVEVGHVNHALEIVRLGQPGDDLVHFVANLLVATERNHVCKTAALGDFQQVAFLIGRLVGNIFDEQEDEDVILVLRGIHAAAQFIARLPEGGVKFGFLDGHGLKWDSDTSGRIMSARPKGLQEKLAGVGEPGLSPDRPSEKSQSWVNAALQPDCGGENKPTILFEGWWSQGGSNS